MKEGGVVPGSVEDRGDPDEDATEVRPCRKTPRIIVHVTEYKHTYTGNPTPLNPESYRYACMKDIRPRAEKGGCRVWYVYSHDQAKQHNDA